MSALRTSPVLQLPHHILARSSLRGNEYAWPLEEIPNVIEAARLSNLASIGGQLQFRLPNGATCECYWIDVDTCTSVPPSVPWQERVTQTATVALADFSPLLLRFDFIAEGRRSFSYEFERFESEGGNLTQTMCFVWYLDDGRASEG
jgi:hypothetical protein